MERASAISDRKLTPTARISRRSARHRWWVLAATLLTLVAAVVASATFAPQLQDGADGVGDSKAASDILSEKFPQGTPSPEQLLATSFYDWVPPLEAVPCGDSDHDCPIFSGWRNRSQPKRR